MSLKHTFGRLQHVVLRRLEPISEQLRAAWQRRLPRERLFLSIGAGSAAAAILWTLGLQPALERIRNANQQLPVLQAQFSRLNTVVLEARALERGRSGIMSADETHKAINAGLLGAGLDAQSKLRRLPDSPPGDLRWHLDLDNAPAERVFEWMSSLPFAAQVQTVSVDLARTNIEGRDRPGYVSGAIVLSLPATEGQ